MKTGRFVLVCLASVPTVLIGVRAEAGLINVNFTGRGSNLAPTDSPGVVAGANWNNVRGPGSQGAASSGTNIVLQDSAAAPTTALLSWYGFQWGAFSQPMTSNPATNLLYGGGIFGNPTVGQEVSINVTNIPYSLYDVYVYASQDTGRQETLSISNGATTFYYAGSGLSNSNATSLLLTTSTDPLNPTRSAAQYQIFRNMTDSTLNLVTGGSIDQVLSNNVFGLQIVAVPEPTGGGVLAGIALVVVGAGSRLRRKVASVSC